MSLLRWIPTFLAFPLGGFLSMLLFGGVDDVLSALAAGVLVGASIGGAQWLALGRATSRRWLALTTAAVAIGSVVAFLVAGSPVTTGAVVVTGLVTGTFVGAAQGVALGRGLAVAGLWTAVVAVSWSLGWLVTSFVIVDLDRGHAVFGSSGAVVVTIVTGVVLRLLMGRRPRDRGALTDAAAAASEQHEVRA